MKMYMLPNGQSTGQGQGVAMLSPVAIGRHCRWTRSPATASLQQLVSSYNCVLALAYLTCKQVVAFVVGIQTVAMECNFFFAILGVFAECHGQGTRQRFFKKNIYIISLPSALPRHSAKYFF